MKITLLLPENGTKPICSVTDKRGLNYIVYEKSKETIKKLYEKLDKNHKELKITEKNITISNGNDSLSIINYKNNKTKELAPIIEKLTKDFRRKKIKKLKSKRVKRINALLGAVLISSSMLVNVLTPTEKLIYEKTDENNLDSQEEIVAIVDETTYNDNSFTTEIQEEYTNEDNMVELDYESRIDSEKFIVAKKMYKEKISSIAGEYGIDPQIILAIATQESGVHRPNNPGPAIGLMQIERSVWVDQKISAYNYKKGCIETFTITEEKLKDLDFNIRVACMIFRNCYKNSHYNLAVAIQMYNFGYGNINKTFNYAYGQNISQKQDNHDNEWLDYRSEIKVGDNEYLEHVVSYIEEPSMIKCKGNNSDICYGFECKNKVRTK